MHNQLREAGFDFQFVENSEAVIIDRLLATEDWQMAVLTWESPFDPDPVLRNSIAGLMNWQHGSPEGGPRTGPGGPGAAPQRRPPAGAWRETDKLVNASAVGPSQEDRIPHYDALFQNWTDNGWNYHIAQYNSGWAGQGNLEGFEFRDVDGWGLRRRGQVPLVQYLDRPLRPGMTRGARPCAHPSIIRRTRHGLSSLGRRPAFLSGSRAHDSLRHHADPLVDRHPADHQRPGLFC